MRPHCSACPPQWCAARSFAARRFAASWLASLLALAAAVQAAPPDSADATQQAPPARSPDAAQLAAWVEQLGDDQFLRREAAEQQLLGAGPAAEPMLREALRSVDVEVRRRARRVLVLLLEMEFQRKVKAFLADIKGEREHNLPAWQLFQERVGGELADRKLFVEMLREEQALLRAMESGGNMAPYLTQRLDVLYRYSRAQALKPSALGAVLLAASQSSDAQALMMPMYRLLTRTDAKTAIESRAPLGRLFSSWMLSTLETPGLDPTYPLYLVLRYDDAELGRRFGRSLLKQESASSGSQEKAAICVARFGNLPEDVELLLPLLESDKLIHTWSKGNVIIRTQLKDRALSLLLHMFEQDPKQFGFEHALPNEQYVYQLYSCGFEKDEQREEAHAKWKKWWEANQQQALADLGKRREASAAQPPAQAAEAE